MYKLTVGTTGPGSSNICSWGPSTATSAPVCGINLNGENFYARLSSLINGVWFSTDYTYATEQAAFPQLSNAWDSVERLRRGFLVVAGGTHRPVSFQANHWRQWDRLDALFQGERNLASHQLHLQGPVVAWPRAATRSA